MPSHVFEGAVCTRVCRWPEECNEAGIEVSCRGCEAVDARKGAHTQVVLELICLCRVVLGQLCAKTCGTIPPLSHTIRACSGDPTGSFYGDRQGGQVDGLGDSKG